MPRAIVIYYSESGNTKKMAEFISEAIKESDVEVDLRDVSRVQPKDLLAYDGIIVGSPTYYGSMAYQVKKLFDESVKFHGSLDGKVGAAFTSSANIGGGNETTILDILNAMLIHGMIIQGDYSGDHYGRVSVGKPDSRVEKQCMRLGKRVAELIKRIK